MYRCMHSHGVAISIVHVLSCMHVYIGVMRSTTAVTSPLLFSTGMPDVSCFLRICAFREFLQKARHRVADFKFGIGSTACAFYRKCQEFALSDSGIAPSLHSEKGSICYLVTYFCSKLNSKKSLPENFWMMLNVLARKVRL